MQNPRYSLVLSLFLVGLFFAVCPWFVSVNGAAKAFLFFFFSLMVFLKMILEKTVLVLDVSFPLWGLLLAAFVLSAFSSKDPASAFLTIFLVLAAALLFFWSCNLVREGTCAAEGLMLTVLFIAMLFAILGLGQFYDHALNGRPAHMVIPYLLPASWWPRLSGPFGQPNFHALVMVTGLCAHAYLLFSQVWEKQKPLTKAVFFLPAGLLWVNFFLTDSRGGKVGFGVLALVFSSYLCRNWQRFRGSNIFLRGLGCLAVALLAWGVAKGMVFGLVSNEKLSTLQVAQSGSIASRINTWTSSLLIFSDHPLLGIGLDNFKGYLYEYQVKANELLHFEYEDMLYTRWAHNEYLQVLAEGGLLAFVPFVILLFSFGRRIFTNLRSTSEVKQVFLCLSPIPFFVQAAFDWPLRHPPLLALCLVLIAFSLPMEKNIEIPLTFWRKWTIAFLLALILGGGCWASYWEVQLGQLKDVVSDDALLDDNFNRMQILAGNPVLEFTVLNQAILPFARYAIKNADVALANKLLPLINRGIYLEGAYWQWYNKARVLLVAGKEVEAKKAIRKALDLNPIHEPSWGFLHYLDVLNASRVLGRPVESFYPKGKINLELPDVGDFSSKHK